MKYRIRVQMADPINPEATSQVLYDRLTMALADSLGIDDVPSISTGYAYDVAGTQMVSAWTQVTLGAATLGFVIRYLLRDDNDDALVHVLVEVA